MKLRTASLSLLMLISISAASAVTISGVNNNDISGNYTGETYAQIYGAQGESISIDIPWNDNEDPGNSSIIVRDAPDGTGEGYDIVEKIPLEKGKTTYKIDYTDGANQFIGLKADHLEMFRYKNLDTPQVFPRFEFQGAVTPFESGDALTRFQPKDSESLSSTSNKVLDGGGSFDQKRIEFTAKKDTVLNSVQIYTETAGEMYFKILANPSGTLYQSGGVQHGGTGMESFSVPNLKLQAGETYHLLVGYKHGLYGSTESPTLKEDSLIRWATGSDTYTDLDGNAVPSLFKASLSLEPQSDGIPMRNIQPYTSETVNVIEKNYFKDTYVLFNSDINSTRMLDIMESRDGYVDENNSLVSREANNSLELKDPNADELKYLDIGVEYDVAANESSPARASLRLNYRNSSNYSVPLNEGVNTINAGTFGLSKLNGSNVDISIKREVTGNRSTGNVTITSVAAAGTLKEPIFSFGVFGGSASNIQDLISEYWFILLGILVIGVLIGDPT